MFPYSNIIIPGKMEKIFQFVSTAQTEADPIHSSELMENIRGHTIEDLVSLSEALKHLDFVVETIQHHYQEILRENQQFKSLLRDFVEDCYCWQGNRCQRCQTILDALFSKSTEKITQPIPNPGKIREKLRKQG